MRLIEEYVRTVLQELKVDRKFVGRLRRGVGPSLASKGREAAAAWIRDVESDAGPLSQQDKRTIVDFAASRYSKLYHKVNEDEMAASHEMHRLLDLKFSSLRLK